MYIKLNYFLLLSIISFGSLTSNTAEKKVLNEWIMNRQQWQPATRLFIEKHAEDSDAQILLRYLELCTKTSLENNQSEDALIKEAEQTIKFCPGDIAQLEYVLTGKYPEGSHILIAVTEAKWIEHLRQVEEKIQKKSMQAK